MSRNSRTWDSRPSDRCLAFLLPEPHPRAANELDFATPAPRPRLPCCHRKRKTRLQASVRLVPHHWLRLSLCSPNPLRPNDPVSRASHGDIFRQSTRQPSVVADTPCRTVCRPDSAAHSSEDALAAYILPPPDTRTLSACDPPRSPLPRLGIPSTDESLRAARFACAKNTDPSGRH